MSQSYSIGVDLGGTNLRIASYSGGIDFLEIIQIPTRLVEGREQVVRDICQAVEQLVSKRSDANLVGIGIGSPGPLELPEGIVRNPPNLPGWDGFPLRAAIEAELGRPVELESDANLAALAEQKLGAGKMHRVDSLAVLTLGTGVGSGLILEGRIWHGATGMGGEAGHIIVQDRDGAACGCGGSGCLEQYASASAIVRMAQELMQAQAPETAQEVARMAQAGDLRARRVFEQVGHALAIALTGLINTLNLPLYLLGGGVCRSWDLFAPTMMKELHERSYIYRLTEPEILQPVHLQRHKSYIQGAQLGTTAGLLGACLLPFQPKTQASDLAEGTFVHQ